ncbi:tail fiber domain-containing protein [Pluralibacter gergoviae]|nr:tail fiber domain-containing protein [Pluralibacter gergoviae]ELD4303982.1 tail fiber domain-containing protein [Pluralibacter gergoviae]
MADIFTGKLFKLLINKDAGNTLPNGTEITNIASMPTLQINSQALQYETYESEFNTYLLSSKSIGAFDITVSYIHDNATHKLLDSYTDSRDEFQVILKYQEVDNRVTYAIVSGRITGASVSGSKDNAVTKAYHFAPEVEVMTFATLAVQDPLYRGDYGVGSNTTDVAQYQPTTPAGNSFIKVPAAQSGNPAGSDLLGIANVDGTAITEFAMTKSGSLSLYAKNQSTAWTRIYTATQMDDRYVQRTVKINGKQLSGDITLNSNDVGALPKTGGLISGNVQIRNPVTNGGTFLDVGSESDSNYSRITLARLSSANGPKVANLKITPEGYLQFGIQNSVNQNAPDRFMLIDDSKISFTGSVVFNNTYQGDEAPIDIGGTTTDLNTLMIGGALADNPGAKRTYICASTGGGANITNVPPGVSGNFFLEVIATRKANATDYNGFQQLYSGDTKKVFRRFYNRTSTTTFTDWAEVSSGVQTIALGGTGATTAAAARNNLDVYSKSEVKMILPSTSGSSQYYKLGNVKDSGTNPGYVQLEIWGGNGFGGPIRNFDIVNISARGLSTPTDAKMASLITHTRYYDNSSSALSIGYVILSDGTVDLYLNAPDGWVAGITIYIKSEAGRTQFFNGVLSTLSVSDEKWSTTAPTGLGTITPARLYTSRNTIPLTNGGTGATDAAGARKNLGAVNIAGDTMLGNLAINTPGNADASLTFNANKSGVRGNNTGDIVVYSSPGRSIHLRPNGDVNDDNITRIDSNGLITAKSIVITATQPTQGNALTRKDYVDGLIAQQVSKSGDTMNGSLTINNGNLTVNNPDSTTAIDIGNVNNANYSRLTISRSISSTQSRVANMKVTPEGYVQLGIQNTVGQGSPDRYIQFTDSNIQLQGATVFNTNYQGDEAPVSIAGQTLDLNTVVMSGNYSDNAGSTRNYICQSSGGGANITNKPSGVSGNFYLQVIGTRRVSNTDYAGFQQLYSSDTGKVYRRRYIGDANGVKFNPDWEEVTSGVQTIANGGTGATTAAAALNNIGALPIAGGTMTGNLTISRPTTDAFLNLNGAAIRGNSNNDMIISSANGRTIYLRAQGDNSSTNQVTINSAGVLNTPSLTTTSITSSGALTAGSITANGDLTVSSGGDIVTTSDNSMVRVGNNGDLALLKKGANNGKIVVGSNTSFVVAKSNKASGITPSDTLTDLFTIGSNGDVTTTGNTTINGDLLANNLNTQQLSDTATSIGTGQIQQHLFSADGKTERLRVRMYGDIRGDGIGYGTIGVKQGTNNETFFSFQQNGDFTAPRNLVANGDVWGAGGYNIVVGTAAGGNKNIAISNRPNDTTSGDYVNTLYGNWYNDHWSIGGVRGDGTDLNRVQINVESPASNKYGYFQFRNDGSALGNWQNTSDLRIKDNVQRITDPLDKMKQLSGCTWDLKTNGSFGIGFIAQEVEKVFDRAVSTAEAYTLELPDGEKITDLKSLDAGSIAAGLHHEAILALMAKVEALEAKLAALTGESEEPVQDTETTPEVEPDEQSQADDDTQNK